MLVVVTTNGSDTDDISSWLQPQLPDGEVRTATGFHAAMSLLGRSPRAVVADVGSVDGRDDWRLAELRQQAATAAFVVVADATHLPMIAGATHADLAVTAVHDLPPLRELLVTDEPLVTDQSTWRRSSR